MVLAARLAHPHWGPRKLLWVLEKRHPEVSWPAANTVSSPLRQHDLSRPRCRRRPKLTGGDCGEVQHAKDL